MDLPDAKQTLHQLTDLIIEANETHQLNQPVLIGIMTGGLWVADHIAKCIALSEPVGSIDIGFHRDDYHKRSSIGDSSKVVQPSYINHDLEGRDVILVDDVLHTGRTIRAALNHLFEYGRPRCIKLAVLLSRHGRELPIQPDYCPVQLDQSISQRIKLTGPDPIDWQICENQNG